MDMQFFARESEQGWADFRSNAGAMLSDHSPRILHDFVDGRLVPVKWHPHGFAIFRTSLTQVDITLRLHAWPTPTMVPGSPWGPRVHSHGWHLAGRVVLGKYSDRLVTVGASGELDALLAPVLYLEHGVSRVADDAHLVRLKRHAITSYKVGETHWIAAGQFHETVDCAAPLTLTVVAVGGQRMPPYVAAERPIYGGLFMRKSVSDEEYRRLAATAAEVLATATDK